MGAGTIGGWLEEGLIQNKDLRKFIDEGKDECRVNTLMQRKISI